MPVAKPTNEQLKYWNRQLQAFPLSEDRAANGHKMKYVGGLADLEYVRYGGTRSSRKMRKAKRQNPQISRWLRDNPPVKDLPVNYLEIHPSYRGGSPCL